jgi:hypothetical protein
MLYAASRAIPTPKSSPRDIMCSHSTLQFSLITTLQNDKILVREPIGFEVRAHKVGSNWHVPFTIENLQFTYESFEMPSKLLCIDL